MKLQFKNITIEATQTDKEVVVSELPYLLMVPNRLFGYHAELRTEQLVNIEKVYTINVYNGKELLWAVDYNDSDFALSFWYELIEQLKTAIKNRHSTKKVVIALGNTLENRQLIYGRI